MRADVRIVSATNRDLPEMVEKETFRRDLYHRLAGHTVSLPPLRERKGDIPQLLCFFMHDLEHKATPTGNTLRLLEEYNYPGNIRELKYIIELAALKAVDGHIYPEHLPEQLLSQEDNNSGSPVSDATAGHYGTDKNREVSGLRRKEDSDVLGTDTREVLDTLQACRGNRRAAAKELGISERKIYRLIRRYEEMGLTVPRPYQ